MSKAKATTKSAKSTIPTTLKPQTNSDVTNSGKLFFAEVTKGYIPKTTFDALATSLSRITLRLSKKGMFIRDSDDCENVCWAHVLWDVSWVRKKFKVFNCTEQMTVTLNAKHLQKMLRNVKKKDSLTFFIRKSDRNQLGIVIQPAGSQTGGPASRSETVYLSIQHIEATLPLLPEMYIDETGIERKVYGNPMIIGATDFQKIKKMAGSVTTLVVKMQKSNYISFHAGDENVMSSHLNFGQLTMKPEDDTVSESEDDENSSNNGSEESDSEESPKQQDIYEVADSESETSEYPNMYEKTFTMSLFVPLIKLPGLTHQMEFYAPRNDKFPLKVSMSATSGLGEISVFIKDLDQINLNEDKRVEVSIDTPSKKSGKK